MHLSGRCRRCHRALKLNKVCHSLRSSVLSVSLSTHSTLNLLSFMGSALALCLCMCVCMCAYVCVCLLESILHLLAVISIFLFSHTAAYTCRLSNLCPDSSADKAPSMTYGTSRIVRYGYMFMIM